MTARDAWFYLDSSAVVKLLNPEPESGPLARAVLGRGAGLITSGLTATEVSRAMHALGRPDVAARVVGSDASALRLAQAVVRTLPVSGRLLVAAGELAPGSPLRSLDAIHVATAQALQPHLAGVVTYDARMAQAARDAGLRVLSPGKAA